MAKYLIKPKEKIAPISMSRYYSREKGEWESFHKYNLLEEYERILSDLNSCFVSEDVISTIEFISLYDLRDILVNYFDILEEYSKVLNCDIDKSTMICDIKQSIDNPETNNAVLDLYFKYSVGQKPEICISISDVEDYNKIKNKKISFSRTSPKDFKNEQHLDLKMQNLDFINPNVIQRIKFLDMPSINECVEYINSNADILDILLKKVPVSMATLDDFIKNIVLKSLENKDSLTRKLIR